MATKRSYRRHQLSLGDGGRLLLERDGTIRAIAPDGTVAATWTDSDADWAAQLRRFGVAPPAMTITPRRQNMATDGIRP